MAKSFQPIHLLHGFYNILLISDINLIILILPYMIRAFSMSYYTRVMNNFNYTCNITLMQQNDGKNLKTLGNRIKELRSLQSSSLNKFVFNRSGVTSATWSRVENGLVDVKFCTLVKIAAMLGISLENLVKNLDINYDIQEL